MNRRKKVVLICSAAAAFVAAASFGITLAYLGDTTGKDNTVIVGHGDEEISEEFSAPSEVSMSNEVEKKFYITNTGTVPLFARLYAEFSDSTIADKAKVKIGTTEYSWANFKSKMALPPEDRGMDNNILPKNWRYMPENPENPENGKLGGYFYYTKVLPTSAKATPENPKVTERLFDSVVYSYSDVSDESNIDLISGFEMIVYSETVQTVETGSVEVPKMDEDDHPVLDEHGNRVMETVYGYDYAEKNEWLEAWKSYLRVSSATSP